MSKSVRRARGRRANALRSRTPRSLLDRILDTPHLARVVPRLPPDVLHRVIQICGLEDCGELVALATPDQLARVFDLDLWRAGAPGLDEQFDADRFGVWLEVIMESGAAVAARILAGIDAELSTLAFARHVRVIDPAVVLPTAPTDDEETPTVYAHDGLSLEIGGYRVLDRGTGSWDAVVAALAALDAERPAYFHRVMRACRRLSNSGFEIDGLDDLFPDDEQSLFDLAFSRERRRDEQGYVTPAQARAFLQMSRQLQLGLGTTPPGNPVARAYFRALEWTTADDTNSGSRRLPAASDAAPAPDDPVAAVAAFVDVLRDAGILPQQPRALLDGPQGPAPRLARIQAHMQFAGDRDQAAFSMRGQELAFLANTIVAGCSIQARPFTAQEASDAAAATCNLGLENWPPHWLPETARRDSSVVEAGSDLPEDFLVDHDLVSVFQVGWTVLHEEVCMYAAEGLISVLRNLRCDDRETRAGLNALRIAMTKHWQAGAPWHARDALDVMTILDMPAWAALLGLIDECPVLHAGIGASHGSRTRAVSASSFEFISENSQIASVREFMQLLPDTLRP